MIRLVLRTTMACLAVGLAATALRIAGQPVSALTLAAVFLIFCAARMQNDWRDRRQDIKKGKTFAARRPRLFASLLLANWAACGALIGLEALRSVPLALLLAAMVVAGLVYSETRRVPWMPISISVITSASPAFIPSTLVPGAKPMLPLFAAAALFILGRELLKDLDDRPIDGGYKWTIPVAYGERTAKWVAVLSLAGACVACAAISPLTLLGIVVAAVGVTLIGLDGSRSATLDWLDAGAALVILALLVFPTLPAIFT